MYKVVDGDCNTLLIVPELGCTRIAIFLYQKKKFHRSRDAAHYVPQQVKLNGEEIARVSSQVVKNQSHSSIGINAMLRRSEALVSSRR